MTETIWRSALDDRTWDSERNDAARYRWLRTHARLIYTDKQWQVRDYTQKELLDQLIDAELRT